jgi:hypothetical protein
MGSGTVFTSTVANNLKNTLEVIVDDKTDGVESRAIFPKFFEIRSMKDQYEDDLEMGGPGLATETPEGSELTIGTITEGTLFRYIARKFGLKLIITEEAIEDSKYEKVLRGARRLKRALWKTADIDGANVLVRGWNTAFNGGDGVPLFSASHTLPQGGTYSNTLGTALSFSRIAVAQVTTALRKLPGHDGVTEGYEPVRVLCPEDLWYVVAGVLGSRYSPEAGKFNEVNVVNQDLHLDAVSNRYWSNTATNWCIQSDCPDGLNWRWRRRARNRSWVDNDFENMKYSISARWSRGWSDARSVYGSQF